MTGIVYKSTGSWYTVRVADGTSVECRIRGKFRMHGIKSTNPVAAGDKVDIQIDENTGKGNIVKIHERHNYIIRKSVNLSKQTHIIAANIDRVFLVVTIDNPPTTTTFIDRFLVTAEAYGIEAILLFNKIDTLTDEALDEQLFLQHTYSEIGYQCLRISATRGDGMDKLKELMKNKVSMFSGHSGVGKSTLINAMEPALDLRTKHISEQSRQGKHTTTFAEMHDLSFGGQIIDTPGIKGFGVVDIAKEELSGYFPEFFKLKSECRFNNCMHRDEPGCAVKAALDNDEVAWSRYRSYVQILDNDDESYRADVYGEGKTDLDE